MKHSNIWIFEHSLILLALCAAGCFNEPEPAYKSVPAANRIYLSDKGLESVPAVNAEADYLNLDRNRLTNVVAVAQLTKLKWLRLNDNRLSSLPELKGLVNLRRIYLKNNRFAVVPEALKDLPALTDIDLSGNPIEEVPAWLAAKPGLKNLSFSRTQIRSLPDDLSAWRSLDCLQLGDLELTLAEMARIRAALPSVTVIF